MLNGDVIRDGPEKSFEGQLAAETFAEVLSHMSLVRSATSTSALIIASTINARMRPYSTAVAARQSLIRRMALRIDTSPPGITMPRGVGREG